MIKEYVLGFAFDHIDGKSVLLINKIKPDWQAGKLNAVGGKIEPGELPKDAMVREFYEETGLTTTVLDWHNYCIMSGSDFKVYVFKSSLNIYMAKSVTDEKVEVVCDYWLPKEKRLISNIRWLIEMSKDVDTNKGPLLIDYVNIK